MKKRISFILLILLLLHSLAAAQETKTSLLTLGIIVIAIIGLIFIIIGIVLKLKKTKHEEVHLDIGKKIEARLKKDDGMKMLSDYIKSTMQQGYSFAQIRDSLMQQGWKDWQIKQAFEGIRW